MKIKLFEHVELQTKEIHLFIGQANFSCVVQTTIAGSFVKIWWICSKYCYEFIPMGTIHYKFITEKIGLLYLFTLFCNISSAPFVCFISFIWHFDQFHSWHCNIWCVSVRRLRNLYKGYTYTVYKHLIWKYATRWLYLLIIYIFCRWICFLWRLWIWYALISCCEKKSSNIPMLFSLKLLRYSRIEILTSFTQRYLNSK